MPEILETKIRCADLSGVRQRLVESDGTRVKSGHQRDTYFHVTAGWLKLRVVADGAWLVAYRRYEADIRTCRYISLHAQDPDACRAAFEAVLGTMVDVRKTREEWKLGLTVVHLDEVAELGSFVELETDTAHHPRPAPVHEGHLRALSLADEPDIRTSYADLLLAKQSS